jgi:hypothetical protein
VWTARKKRIVLASAAFLAALLAALYFAAAHLIDSQWVRDRATAEINKALGGTVHFEKTSLLVFPRPCLMINEISFDRPEIAGGTIKRAEIHPRVLSLFKGEFQVASAVLDTPDITTATPAPREEPFSPETIRKKIIPVLIKISNWSPGTDLRIINGKLRVQRANRSPMVFEGIGLAAGISSGELSLNLAGASSPWGPLALRGRFSFAEDRLAAGALSVSAGDCSLAGAEASLTWEEDAPLISAEVNQAGIDFKNLRDWGVFSKLRKGPVLNINSIDGRVNLSSVRISGPLLAPSEWDYAFSGDLDRVALHTALAAQVMKLDTGRFSAAHDPQSPRDSSIEAIGIQGSIGKSSFENVTVLLKGTGDGTSLQAEADAASLDLAEIVKWRALQDFRRKSLGMLKSLQGTARVEKLQAEGPLKDPAKWTYAFSGSLDDLAFELSGVPYPFKIRKADIGMSGSASENAFSFAGASGNFGTSSFAGVSGKLRTDGAGRLEISGGRTKLALGELARWDALGGLLGPVTSVKGSVTLNSFKFAGALPDPATWSYAAAGTARGVRLEFEDFPSSQIDGMFRLDQDTLFVKQARASVLDSSMSLAGQVRIAGKRFNSAALDIAGTVGRSTLAWASRYQPVPEYVKVPSSIAVRNSRLEGKGPKDFSLKGVFIPEDGPVIGLDLARDPKSWNVREFHVKDAWSDARISLKTAPDGTDFSYSGSLYKKTVDALVFNELEEKAFISGNLSGRVPAKSPILASLTGKVSAGDILVPLKKSSHRFRIEAVTLNADRDKYEIESSAMSWGEQNFTAAGTLMRRDEQLHVDLDVSAELVVYERLMAMIREIQAGEDDTKPSAFWELPLRGKISVSSERYVMGKYAAEPCSVDIAIGPNLVRLNFTKNLICGMPLPGTIDFTPAGHSMKLRSSALNMELAPVLACLMEESTAASGKFDFKGEAAASGKLPDSLKGEFSLTARNGLIYRARLLSSILEYLNITQIFIGRLPRIGAEGLPYRLVSIKGRINGTKLEITEFELRGPTLGLAGEGVIDLATDKIEMTIIVSPLRTFDYIVSRIPVVKYFFTGILAIPVGVYGKTSNPIIVPLDPSAIGAQLYTIMKRIINAPVKFIESFK